MIVEARDEDDETGLGTKDIVSIDPKAQRIPIDRRDLPSNLHYSADLFRDTIDRVENNVITKRQILHLVMTFGIDIVSHENLYM